MSNQSFNLLSYSTLKRAAILVGLCLGAFTLSAVAEGVWNEATALPPHNNVDAPINAGVGGQVKLGSLSLNSYLDSTMTTPTKYGLVVNNSPIKAAGGLIIETRTSDPASPETGRMWLIQ